jgi:hypothetical protein
MYSRECILAGMHSLKCIPKIEDPNTGLEKKKEVCILGGVAVLVIDYIVFW